MAIVIDSLATARKTTQGFFRNRFPGWDLGPRGFWGKLSDVLSLVVMGLLRAARVIEQDAIPSNKTSADGLNKWAFAIGLDNGDGGYGRRKADAATGGAGLCTGLGGTVFADGLVLTASDGVTKVALSGAVTIAGAPPVTGSGAGVFIAQTAGTVGNLDAGEVLTWDSPPAGADSSVTLTTGLSGGVDEDTDAATLTKIYERWQVPPKGGADADYSAWAEAIDGVAESYVYPRRQGTGTVDVVIAAAGTGTARKPSTAVQTAVEESIADLRPVAVEGVTVWIPYMPGANGKTIRCRVVPASTANAFDWVDTAGWTVDLYAAGPPATLRLPSIAPASLKNAINAYKAVPSTGPAPRIQVLETGGAVIPIPVRCVDFVDGGGKTTLTLETPLPAGWIAPTVGDVIYAYGPIVETIATDLLAVVDSLGPSRAGGYGSAVLPWNDRLTISGLMAAAENAVDEDGEKLISYAIVNGTTINAVEADVVGTDTTLDGPELLHAKYIAVTQ